MSSPSEKGKEAISKTDEKEEKVDELLDEEEEESKEEWIGKCIKMTEYFENYCMHLFKPTVAERLEDLNYNLNHKILCNYDTLPLEKRKTKYEQAMFEYLRGRLLNAVPGYKEEAETHLSKAVMLKPTLADAWQCLASCSLKKGDLDGARSHLNFALALARIPDKKTECHLSELERDLALTDTEDEAEHIDASIKHARKAVNIDDKDGFSWYYLGRAYMLSFHLTGEWDHNTVLQALDAFEKAKMDVANRMDTYPFLQYDYAAANTFLENYERALTEFRHSWLRNPVLDAKKDIDMWIRLLDKLDELLQVNTNDKGKGKNKGKGKGKSKGTSMAKSEETSLDSLIASLASIDLDPSYERANLDLLSEGLNKGVAVIGIVLYSVKNENKYPLYYVFSDSEQNRFVVTVKGIRNEAIKKGDQVTLLEPCCKFIDFEWEGKHYQFKSVQVNLLEQVLVNGKSLPPNLAIRESVR